MSKEKWLMTVGIARCNPDHWHIIGLLLPRRKHRKIVVHHSQCIEVLKTLLLVFDTLILKSSKTSLSVGDF